MTILPALFYLQISPSDLPWWGWLLVALGCLVVFVTGYVMFDYSESGLGVILMIGGGLAGVIFGGIGIVRFIKWVWAG
jgi:hypothetical protein